MNISPINNDSQTNFNGKIITKGKWTESLKKEFLQNKEIQKIASGKYDIIGHMSRKKTDALIPVFKLEVEAISEKPSKMEKLKSFLGLTDVVALSDSYHTEMGTSCLMENRLKAKHIAKLLNIEV